MPMETHTFDECEVMLQEILAKELPGARRSGKILGALNMWIRLDGKIPPECLAIVHAEMEAYALEIGAEDAEIQA